MRRFWEKYYYREKAVSVTDSEFMFVSLAIQHVKRIRRVILSSHKREPFSEKGYWTKNVFWFSVQYFSEIILNLKLTLWSLLGYVMHKQV